MSQSQPSVEKPEGRRLTDSFVKKAPLPATGYWIIYDTEVPGFGLRCTAGGARSFILNYYTRGSTERRYTIGRVSDNWSVAAARKEAKETRRKLPDGYDPVKAIEDERGAKTVAAMCARFIEDHLPALRARTALDYRGIINNEILPVLGRLKLADVKPGDVDDLHRKITRGYGEHRARPYRANRTAALLSKMFNLAVHRWRWLSSNPVQGLERNQEAKRERYLKNGELQRLTEALAVHEDRQAANIIRLLLLTGARRSEVFAMRWADLNLTDGTWTKPASTTKQKKTHVTPLSAPARQLLSELSESAKVDAEYVFPGRWGGHRTEVRRAWRDLCRAANIKGVRVHDLRHSFASQLVSSGFTLPVIGALLGHSNPATTARYAHLFDEVTRQATERVGAVIAGNGKPSAEIVPHRKPKPVR
jgi:integrase